MTRAPKTQRYCARCGNRLSSYNAQKFCHPCDLAFREQLAHPPEVPAGFWQTDRMRDALSTWHIGQVIYAYRLHPHHGRVLPQELIASWLGLTQAQLSRIENGSAPEQLSRLTQWAQALRIPAELLWFKLPASDGEASVPEQHDGEADVRLARWLFAGGRGTPPASSRTGDLEQIALALDDGYRYFDGAAIAFFREQLTKSKADDGIHGSAAALPLALAILAAVREHCKGVKSSVRQPLLALGADGAEFVGWLYRDLRQPIAAGYWYDRAIEMAQEANDLAMQGYVLLRKSQMAYDDRDGSRVLSLAEAAHHGPWQLPVALRSEITQQIARGLAMGGESFGEVERKLDEARQVLARGQGNESDEHTHRLRSASTYIEAGRPIQAVSIYRTALDSGALSTRDEGYFRARHAVALALCGDPDSAADEGLLAIRCATEKQSARTKQELVRAIEAMDRWQHRPGPRELRETVYAGANRL
ncbi:helix-turn-helix transcriptional regulator [Nocardia fluminea]|uniref:helix-turn-helix domain-containing protein n=1 Tax=Nocardia fluminea TaxID=134984 RepID=UPI0033E93FBB